MALSVGFIGVGNIGNPMARNVHKNFPQIGRASCRERV